MDPALLREREAFKNGLWLRQRKSCIHLAPSLLTILFLKALKRKTERKEHLHHPAEMIPKRKCDRLRRLSLMLLRKW